MTLLVDNFAAEVVALTAQGWVILDYSRYDPTLASGLTPSGKAFSLSAVRDGAEAKVTLTVAGNTRTLSLASWEADFEQGNKAAQQIRVCYLKFPPNQR